MRQSRRKTLSALLSFVLLIPMHIVSVSAEDTEPEAAEEIQQTSESSEDEQLEMTAEEDLDSELQENEDPHEQPEEQAPEQNESEPGNSGAETEIVPSTAEESLGPEEEMQENPEEDPDQPEKTPQDDSKTEESEDEEPKDSQPEEQVPAVRYQVHLSGSGWTKSYSAGESSAEGRIEAFRISADDLGGQIIYQSHVQDYGWMNEVSIGAVSGTSGQNRQIEALRIGLSGNAAEKYDITYRVKINEYGWTDWALNGAQCGSEGYSLSLRSMEIILVPKGSVESDPSLCFFKKAGMRIQAHVQSNGWMSSVGNGRTAGTTGHSLRLEALRISLPNALKQLGDVLAAAHVSNIGWMEPVGSGQIIGTTGRSQSIQAIRVSLTGQLAELYDIRYRVHVRNIGWLNYAFNGDTAGTVGYDLAVEAVEILLEKKRGLFPGSGVVSGREAAYEYKRIQYMAHVAHEGWQALVNSPKTAGTVGKSRQMEALKVSLPAELAELGGLNVTVHVQNKGWLDPVESGFTAGTTGESLRIEGIRITLSGQLAAMYDIYYRTHVQGIGWLGWTRNGGLAGSEGCSRWIEAVQIDLVDKVYAKYTLSKSYTTLKLGGNTAALISILKGNLGANMSGFGGYSVPTAYRNALMNEVLSIQNSGYKVGFVMIDLGSERGVACNADQKLYSASSVKGLYIGALLSQNRAAYNNDRANMQTILRTSDNALYSALGNKYGFSYIRNWCNSTGIDSNVCANLYTYYSARDMAKLWVKMDEFFSSGSYGTEIGTWYQNPNRSPIHSQLGGRYITRSKAGWIAESGYSAAVDGGIIYSTKGTYIITVISNLPGSLDRLNGIVNILENIHSSMN